MQTIVRSEAEGIVVLAVVGDVDALTLPDLQDTVEALLADTTCSAMVLDLSAVTFMSSGGLSLLLTTQAQTRRRRIRLRLAGAITNRAVHRPLELTGFLGLFDHDAAASEETVQS
jgi:anti-sigma B factor antagonist